MLGATPLETAPLKEVQAALARDIVGPVLPAAEVQHYCEARVPRLSNFTSLRDWEAEAAQLARRSWRKWSSAARRPAGATCPARSSGWTPSLAGRAIASKLRYEAVPGLWIPALLYEPDQLDGKVPVILNVNGHDGTPGKAVDYKQIRSHQRGQARHARAQRRMDRHGPAPTAGFRHPQINQLNLCGTSGLAPFYLSMKRGLDLLLGLPNADPERVAVTGLSGGGWQTIFISALDLRVKLSTPVAGYSSLLTRGSPPRPGRPGTNAVRPGHGRRLSAPDGDAGAAADVADQQRQGQLLFRFALRLAAAPGRRAAHLPPLWPREMPCAGT